MSYRGTSDLASPNIDALATGGVRLDRYYTHNLCSPSRTAFLSGRFASTIGMQGCVIINGQAVDLPREVQTVADRLRGGGGFATAAFGKWDAGMTTWDYTPTCRGFDYFYGYWNAAQDYYRHAKPSLDLHENFSPVEDQDGAYSTNLYTAKAQAWLTKTVGGPPGAAGQGKADKSFLYLAYQAMHGPIEAPAQYVQSAHCRGVTTENKRNVYCGMMAALDEGIGNLTDTYKQLGIWNDTLVVLATDNGGHVGSSANNAPLRGEKSTNYEGGVRGVGFLHWPGLPPALVGTTTENVVHVSDWLPTFVAGVAGLPLANDSFAYPLDGVDQWAALTAPGVVAPARSHATTGGPAGASRGIVHEIGGDNHIRQEAYLEGPYKLIRYFPTIYDHGRYACADNDCALGWMPLPGRGEHPEPPPAAENRTNGTAATAAALVDGGTWLFNVFADPLEKTDLSQREPAVVTRMVAALAALAARPGCSWAEQKICPVDPLSSPAKYFGGVWTPWRGSREPKCGAGGSNSYCLPPPSPAPPTPPPLPTPPPPPGSHDGRFDGVAVDFGNGTCIAKGWCSAANFGGPPLAVRLLVDGEAAANGTAAVPRPQAGVHGFALPLPCVLLHTAGVHRLMADCLTADTKQWFTVPGSPLCLQNGKKVSCPAL